MRSFRGTGWGIALALLAGCGTEDEPVVASSLISPPSILVDLDPTSTAMTFTVENLTVSSQAQLFFSDRESGNVLRLDPASPTPAIVGTIEDRTDRASSMQLKGNAGGLVFTPSGDLLLASATFNEVLRLSAGALDATSPVAAQTFITGTQGANAIVVDGDYVYVTGGVTGNIYRASLAFGGEAQVWATIAANTRAVPPDNHSTQAVVSNGIARDDTGFMVADTSRGAIWHIPLDPDGSAGTPQMLVQNSKLEGADGISFDPQGRLWAAVNERNALVVVEAGQVHEAYKNGNSGPLEFPAALVFIDDVGYVANYDRPRRDNLAPDGKTSNAGIGSSIARFQL